MILKPLSGFRLVPTRRGDTLQDVAVRELGDAARWYDLAAINDLLPPFLTDDPQQAGPRVLLTGQDLKIPAQAPAASGVPPEAQVFGTNLALPAGRLTGDGNGNLAVLSGMPNLVQSLKHAIDTEPTELRYHPTYGCAVHGLKGRPANEVTNRLAAMFVAQTLRSDPRVARTESVTATITGDTVAVDATAVAVDGKRITVASR